MHNIVFESRRVARTYVDVIDWLVSYAVCELSVDRPNDYTNGLDKCMGLL